MEIRQFRSTDFNGVKNLWEEAFPNDPTWNRAEYAIPAKLAFQSELLLVAVHNDDIIGSAMAGYDGHRGWLYSVAVLRSAQRIGVGKTLVREAERALQLLGCSKINLQIRTTNEVVVNFYKDLGYGVEDRISLGKRL